MYSLKDAEFDGDTVARKLLELHLVVFAEVLLAPTDRPILFKTDVTDTTNKNPYLDTTAAERYTLPPQVKPNWRAHPLVAHYWLLQL